MDSIQMNSLDWKINSYVAKVEYFASLINNIHFAMDLGASTMQRMRMGHPSEVNITNQ